MDEVYLKEAVEKYRATAAENGEKFDIRLFITGVSKRASQLGKGFRKLVQLPPDDHTPLLDVALMEVAQGKVVIKHGDYEAYENSMDQATEITGVDV